LIVQTVDNLNPDVKLSWERYENWR
jgi:hypothetical protein